MSNLKPLGDRVVVQPKPKQDVTPTGIVLPDTVTERPQEGKVIAVGSGRLLDSGVRVPMEVKTGDEVLYAKYGGTEVKLDGEEYLVIRENELLAIFALIATSNSCPDESGDGSGNARIYTPEDLRELRVEWTPYWYLGLPSRLSQQRVHGDII